MNDLQAGTTAYLGIGGNLGDRFAALAAALHRLERPPLVSVSQVSSIYETEPVGVTDQPYFLNLVAEIQTTLPVRELLAFVLRLEEDLGRVRTQRWGPRVIDIDILLYGDIASADRDLVVPHPRLTERAFALVPLTEIAPGVRFPDGESAQKKLQRLYETGNNLSVRVVQ